MIENLICIKEKDLLQWACGESNILVSVSFLSYALVDLTRQLVFVLSEPKPLPTVLTIFNAQGEKLFWSAPPEGATFYYLTFNLSKEVIVVCSYPAKKNGWHDWFYSWDMKRNVLSQSGPAY
ncbi:MULTISPECIES: hypothetical protein [Enterobacter]|jgi:hypothetical protein|uniref:hypothetical protein n=1 Tax=Enterobacter TaxID=547 RepID=UPI0005F97961|nr:MULTISPECIES: hypothetical protein [Enterobacter]ARZ81154.1 hypothetical protein AM409_24205 [Enterobacter cloacae complex sp.]KYJ77459.1 hypothetical protein AT292_21635 [Enterobacter cloacae]MVX97695.1 hypothetical protein [Enterobacteriaceae bacterium 8376wB9]EHF4952383.1 hypothetical protein [Enterobacter hormaechei]EHF5018113.1 hypothetical protein [Enterobacter hormaechei]